jgi:NAD(P)-dependent dehydrogenase (short-subunit alcohol dehydrogenase family)
MGAALIMSQGAGELFDLSGKVAMVTGGSRGLGAAIVHAYARAGADVVVVSRHAEACEAVASEVRAATGRRAFARAAHVGMWHELDGLVDDAYREMGTVDVLVNNAGMSPLYDDVTTVSEALFDKVTAVNLKGPFRLTALVGSRMRQEAGGSIINVSSAGSLRPRSHMLPYAAAKAGLNAATIGFAHTFGPTVRVNCIVPGPFRTDVAASWEMAAVDERQRSYALGRLGEPAEIVGAALYFASDASSFTTGALLQVDGGIP